MAMVASTSIAYHKEEGSWGRGAGEGAQAPLQGRRDHAAAAMPRRPLLPHEHPLRGERDDRRAGVHGVGGDAPVPAAQGAVRAQREAPRRPLHGEIHPQPLPRDPPRQVIRRPTVYPCRHSW